MNPNSILNYKFPVHVNVFLFSSCDIPVCVYWISSNSSKFMYFQHPNHLSLCDRPRCGQMDFYDEVSLMVITIFPSKAFLFYGKLYSMISRSFDLLSMLLFMLTQESLHTDNKLEVLLFLNDPYSVKDYVVNGLSLYNKNFSGRFSSINYSGYLRFSIKSI